jgi:hypothetical protein
MTLDNYKIQLETLLEDNDQSWSASVINKLARRANELQFESDFELSDISDELDELIPESHRDEDDVWFDIVQEFAVFVYDEKESNIDEEQFEESED